MKDISVTLIRKLVSYILDSLIYLHMKIYAYSHRLLPLNILSVKFARWSFHIPGICHLVVFRFWDALVRNHQLYLVVFLLRDNTWQ